MNYTSKKKLINFLSGLIPSAKYRRKFQKRFLSTYDWHRIKYNIGEYSYMGETSSIAHPDTIIGKFCSIAHNVCIGTSQHPTDFLTTHGFAYCEYWPKLYGDIKTPKQNIKDISYLNKPCIIGNDVWIGRNAIIKDGVKIGNGAIVGAGAVVTKDVPPYAIVAGVPAQVKRYRFDQDIIQELLILQWWDLPKGFLTTLPFDNIRECIKLIKEYKTKASL